METIKQPLTNVQVELLKIFSTNLSVNDLYELKQQLVQFYAQKSIDLANKVWVEKGLTYDDTDRWLKAN